ncbi:uncharacterized protein LOC135074091 [Ostrinia nubilalis]|uniref:uncharacterized protein LOC135074091 n=1 Tax=Ostrinia nubilalis TaxID=29057 RepID=UPI00308244B9
MASITFVFAVNFLLVCFVHLSYCGTVIKMPAGCEDKQYCEIKPNNFPQAHFDEVIRDMQEKELLKPQRYDDELKERTYHDEFNCDTRVKVIRPFIIRTNATMKFVLQTNIFEQRIKQTECLNQGSECFKGLAGLGYAASCTPTIGTIKMYLYDPLVADEKERLQYEAVSFPACCSCSFKSRI